MVTMAELLAQAEKTPQRRRPPRDEEHRLQCACVRWFRLSFPQYSKLLFAVPNGGARSKATAGKLKAEGVVAGVADLLLLIPRGGHPLLAIEMKTPHGSQSPDQKAWQKKAESIGIRYIICRKFEDFVQEIREYLNEK